jgi:hypothetical protein
MKDLSTLLTALPFPSALERVRRSFARQPDRQTCGASALRHGLLLGGLTLPAAALEAVLGIRENKGTTAVALRTCLARLGLDVCSLRRSARQSTAQWLDELRPDLDGGAFLIPCIHGGIHWVCLGAWIGGRVGLVDSFFVGRGRPYADLSPGLGFFSLTPGELDALDWDHHVMLVRPGRWRSQYEAWRPARPALLRLNASPGGQGTTLLQAIRHGAHQYLDDAEYTYQRLQLHLNRGQKLAVESDDPGGDAVGVETLGQAGEVLVVRRLGGLLEGRPAVPEIVLRADAVHVGQLAG